MLPVGWLIAAVVLAVLLGALLTAWVTFTATRLDRLHARVDAAQAALDAQLVRRAAALAHVAESAGGGLPVATRVRYERAAQTALAAGWMQRPIAENEVGHAVLHLADTPLELPAAAVGELVEAAVRVQLARRFYNDAVRDTRTLRARRMPRLLHLAGHRQLPQFFDIDDTVPVHPVGTVPVHPVGTVPVHPVGTVPVPSRPEAAGEPVVPDSVEGGAVAER